MINVVVVGRTGHLLGDAVAEYERRAARYWKLSVEEVDGGTGRGRQATPDQVREAEAERILARIPADGDVWLITREGKMLTSTKLAQSLGDRQLHGGRALTLCIGGAFGFSVDLAERAQRKLSLSAMTLPHEMARLVLAEQLYRAGTILRGEPYHKGGSA